MTIEDIILDNDRRGISHLRPYVPPTSATAPPGSSSTTPASPSS